MQSINYTVDSERQPEWADEMGIGRGIQDRKHDVRKVSGEALVQHLPEELGDLPAIVSKYAAAPRAEH